MCHTEEDDEEVRLEVGPLVECFLIAVVEPVNLSKSVQIWKLDIQHS